MSLLVEIDLFRKLRDKVRPLRARADEIHVAAENVPELRYFVDANLANDPSYSRHAVVTIAGPDGTVLLSIHAHRAKLHQRKPAAVLAHALLFVKRWTAGIDLDQNRGDDGDRQRRNRPDQSDQVMNSYAPRLVRAGATPAAGKDEP